MKTYDKLTIQEKVIYDNIDKIFINHISIKRSEFVKVLGILINKYKKRGVENEWYGMDSRMF